MLGMGLGIRLIEILPPQYVLTNSSVRKGAECFNFRFQLSKTKVHHLVVQNAAAKRLSLTCVLNGLLDAPLKGNQAYREKRDLQSSKQL